MTKYGSDLTSFDRFVIEAIIGFNEKYDVQYEGLIIMVGWNVIFEVLRAISNMILSISRQPYAIPSLVCFILLSYVKMNILTFWYRL